MAAWTARADARMCVEVNVVLDVAVATDFSQVLIPSMPDGEEEASMMVSRMRITRFDDSNRMPPPVRVAWFHVMDSCALACACSWRVFVRSMTQFYFECFVVCCMRAQHALQNR